MIVLKFGGTSVSTAKNIKTIGKIAHREMSREPVIVVSALRGVTDLLLSLLRGEEQKKLLGEIRERHLQLASEVWNGDYPKEIISYVDQCLSEVSKLLSSQPYTQEKSDAIVSYGEKMSTYFITKALISFGITAQQVIATDLIVTNKDFGSAEFLPTATTKKVRRVLSPLVKARIVPVITGFIGETTGGKTTTLGRGGSDYTASIIGFCLKADEVQIWTDVDGIFTSDPRYLNTSSLIKRISYREAAELAAFGAKVLHPRTIRPAEKAGIPVRVLNTMNPENKGTLIEVTTKKTSHIVAVTAKKKITLINIYSTDMLLQRGFLSKVFHLFAKYNISVDLVSVSEVSISITLDNEENLLQVMDELSLFSSVTVTHDVGIVSVIGEKIVSVPQIMKRIFTILETNKIEPQMISFGATDINISLVVASSKIEKTVRVLHNDLLSKN